MIDFLIVFIASITSYLYFKYTCDSKCFRIEEGETQIINPNPRPNSPVPPKYEDIDSLDRIPTYEQSISEEV